MSLDNRIVYLLVDGENIDRTLGQILNHKPGSEQRPRWDRIKIFAEKKFHAACRALFFLNANNSVSGSFVQALKTVGYIPILLTGPENVKVVDQGILKTLRALKLKPAKDQFPGIVLVSHDGDFSEALSDVSDRHLAIFGFPEYLSGDYEKIRGLKIYDLETEVKAFKRECGPLPRIQPVHIDDFDPEHYLNDSSENKETS